MANYYPTEDTYLNIARGLVRNTFDVHKFGSNSALGNGLENIETIWDGSSLYPWATWDAGANTVFLASSQSGDTSRVVEIQGLDANYDALTETITLDGSDGTTAVESTNEYIRLFRMRNVGSTDISGNVTAKYGASGGTTVAQITGSANQTLMCVYTIPTGYKGFLTNIEGSSRKSEEITMRMTLRNFGQVFRTIHQGSFIGGQYNFDFSVPFAIDAKTDIDMRAFGGSSGNSVDGTFNLVIIKNPLGS